MISWFTESPFWLFLTGAFVTGVLAMVYTQFQDSKFAGRLRMLIGVSAVLTILPLITSWLIETEREGLQRQIRQMANCVRQNDVDGLLRYVDPETGSAFEQIARELPAYDFSACNVTAFNNVEIEPDSGRAEARFTVFVNVDAPAIGHQGGTLRVVKMGFQRRADGRWMVTSFRHFATELENKLLNSR